MSSGVSMRSVLLKRAFLCHFLDNDVANRELATTHSHITNLVLLRAAGLNWNSWLAAIRQGELKLPVEAGVVVLVQEHDGKPSIVDEKGAPLLLHLSGEQLLRLVRALDMSRPTLRWDEFTPAWQNLAEGLCVLRVFVVCFMSALAAEELVVHAGTHLHVSADPAGIVAQSELDDMRGKLERACADLGLEKAKNALCQTAARTLQSVRVRVGSYHEEVGSVSAALALELQLVEAKLDVQVRTLHQHRVDYQALFAQHADGGGVIVGLRSDLLRKTNETALADVTAGRLREDLTVMRREVEAVKAANGALRQQCGESQRDVSLLQGQVSKFKEDRRTMGRFMVEIAEVEGDEGDGELLRSKKSLGFSLNWMRDHMVRQRLGRIAVDSACAHIFPPQGSQRIKDAITCL